METFFERLAKLFLKIDSTIKNGMTSLFSALNSQLVALFFTLVMIFMTILFIWAWVESSIWMRIVFLLIFLTVLLFSASAVYFFVKRERVNKVKNHFNLENIPDLKNIRTITQNENDQRRLFDAFSETHIQGDFQSFLSLLNVERVENEGRLIWIDTSPNNPKKINRQTLLEFLSQIFIGFENLSNKSIVGFCGYYFILGDNGKDHARVNSKNVSDWRLNRAPYLKEISAKIGHAING